MRYYAGETISDAVYVEDALGDPSVLDAADVFSDAHFTNPVLSTNVNVTVSPGAESGVYVVSFATDINLPGLYYVYLVSSETGTVYTETYNVDPRQPVGGRRFKDFRMACAIELRDGIRAYATQDSAANLFYDQNNLTDGRNAYESTHAVCIESVNEANVGAVRLVDSSSEVSSSIQFAQAFPAAFTTGDQLHLMNLAGLGFRPQVYDEAIQQCIAESYPDALIYYTFDGVSVFDAAAPRIDIPDDMVAIYGVATLEEAETWRAVPSARPRNLDSWGHGYAVDIARRQVVIQGQGWKDNSDGKAYRLFGYSAHRPPVLADDLISIDAKWLMVAVKAKIAGRRVSSREWDSWAVEWGRMESSERMRIQTAREANAIFLQ